MAQPKAAAVAITAEILPNNPSQGLDRTQSPIMHVTIENIPIRMNVELKNGITVLVFFSSSWSSVRDANLAMEMCLNLPVSSATPTASKNASSQAAPLKLTYYTQVINNSYINLTSQMNSLYNFHI